MAQRGKSMLTVVENSLSVFTLATTYTLCTVKKKETLTEDDAMEVFEEIAEVQNRAFQLGLKLKLKNHVAQGICSQHQQPRDKLLYILIEALEKRSLTWKDIADALRSPAIDLPRLSRRIERAHCTKPHSGRTRLPSVGAGGLVARDVRTAPEEVLYMYIQMLLVTIL